MTKFEDRDALQELIELVDSFHVGVLVTIAQGGEPHARPMAIEGRADSSEPFDLLFVTDRRGPKVEELRSRPRAAVTLQNETVFVALSGTVSVELPPQAVRKQSPVSRRLWFAAGPDDRNLVMLRFRVDFAEFWNRSGKRRLQLAWEAGKALIAGRTVDDQPLPGHAKVDFENG